MPEQCLKFPHLALQLKSSTIKPREWLLELGDLALRLSQIPSVICTPKHNSPELYWSLKSISPASRSIRLAPPPPAPVVFSMVALHLWNSQGRYRWLLLYYPLNKLWKHSYSNLLLIKVLRLVYITAVFGFICVVFFNWSALLDFIFNCCC